MPLSEVPSQDDVGHNSQGDEAGTWSVHMLDLSKEMR